MAQEPLTLTKVIDYCKRSYELNKPITLLIKLPDAPLAEVITNPVQNIPAKIEYYQKVYNEDLSHKFSDGIKIVGVIDNTTNIKRKELH